VSGFKSGFVTIIGRPNAGKSTLLNRLVGSKIAIVSEKPQTTRNSIRGIVGDEEFQAVFLDTPGVNRPRNKLEERMMTAVSDSLDGCDIILYLVDGSDTFGAGEEYIIENILKKQKCPVFLLVNKIDLLTSEQLLPLLAAYSQKFDFKEVIPLSGKSGDNTDELKRVLKQYLPEGPQYYPPGMHCDMPEQFLLAELIREQVLRRTAQEVPHSVAVTIAAMEERPGGKLYVDANIYVERDSQKGIIIGKGGKMLREIGSGARAEMERLLSCPIYLDLHVRAKKDWRDNESLLKNWDLTTDD